MDVFWIKFNFSLCKMDNECQKKWIFKSHYVGETQNFMSQKCAIFPIDTDDFPSVKGVGSISSAVSCLFANFGHSAVIHNIKSIKSKFVIDL